MIKILLVEDDELFALDVKMMLDEAFDNIDLLHYTSAQEARMAIGSFDPDVMLVDVVLEDEKSGVLLGKLAEQEKIPVIFMTAYTREDLFKMALRANPYNYLQKPFSQAALKHAIELTLARVKKRSTEKQKQKLNQYILLKSKKGILEKIAINDIYLLEAFGNYCHIHTVTQRYTHRMTLKTFPDIVGDTDFVRIQRNYVININYLDRIDTQNNIITVSGTEYLFSPKYKASIIKKFSRS